MSTAPTTTAAPPPSLPELDIAGHLARAKKFAGWGKAELGDRRFTDALARGKETYRNSVRDEIGRSTSQKLADIENLLACALSDVHEAMRLAGFQPRNGLEFYLYAGPLRRLPAEATDGVAR